MTTLWIIMGYIVYAIFGEFVGNLLCGSVNDSIPDNEKKMAMMWLRVMWPLFVVLFVGMWIYFPIANKVKRIISILRKKDE